MLHGPFDAQFPSQHADRGRANVTVMSRGVTPECGRISLLWGFIQARTNDPGISTDLH
jgi:hypothetical protein